MIRNLLFLFTVFALNIIYVNGQTITIKNAKVETKASFRAISQFENVICVGGNRSTLLWSPDQGSTWKKVEYDIKPAADFRGVKLISDSSAIAISSGSPARIFYLTVHNLAKERWISTDTAWFLDGIVQGSGKQLIIPADPINGFFKLLVSNDLGETWQVTPEQNLPNAQKGEAIFAASNTSLIHLGKDEFALASGGSRSGIYIGSFVKGAWTFYSSPIVQGDPGAGIFGLSLVENKSIMAVGGNYSNPDSTKNTLGYFDLKTRKWSAPESLGGYRSGVSFNKGNKIAAGSNGTEIWLSKQKQWQNLGLVGYNAIQALKSQNGWILVGNKGAISFVFLKN